ncbi:MAG: YkgJ family cysteine cluster protein [Armatimonadetes bacterium]|nr:YkgJ family cysteine cluster protein [Armatimonadota bacterium]
MAGWHDVSFAEDEENPCDGCHECGLRCAAEVQMAKAEFERVVEHLRGVDPRRVIRVMEQEKRAVWFEEIEREACLFYDVTRGGCIVYPARPLVCRLFGRVEWMPCPLEKDLSLIPDGLRLIQEYAGERRATFGEWCTALGMFDFQKLISEGR